MRPIRVWRSVNTAPMKTMATKLSGRASSACIQTMWFLAENPAASSWRMKAGSAQIEIEEGVPKLSRICSGVRSEGRR